MNCEGCKTRLVVLLVLLSSASVWSGAALALDPKKAITQYVHDVWTVENGLPQNSVQAITQTHDGYLWLGSLQGLVRFDGVRFTVFDSGNTKELKSNYVSALYEDRDGSLWIGTGDGLLRFKDGRFTRYTTSEGLYGTNGVAAVYGDQHGNLWVGLGSGGLNRLKDGRFTYYTTQQGLSHDNVKAIHEDREGDLWIGTKRGLNLFKDGRFTHYATREGLSHNWVRSICKDREGSLWIGTYGGGLNRLKNGKLTGYTTKDGLSHNVVEAVYTDREGNLWIGTAGGLHRFKDGKLTRFTVNDGLSHNNIMALYEDREGSLWIGTQGGLNRLKDGKLTSFTTREGLSADWMTAVCEDREGNLWIGGAGLDRFKDGEFANYSLKGSLRNGIKSLSLDREGQLWIGAHAALFQSRQGRLTPYITEERFALFDVASICKDRGGNLWIATGRGLLRLKDGRFTSFTTKDGLSNEVVIVVYEDRQGILWLGTETGLDRLKDGRFTRYATKDGLPATQVTSIYEDQDGTLWIGTRGDGLFRFKDDRLMAYTTKEGLFDNVVTTVLEDGKRNLWMGSFRGIFRVSKKELDDVAEGRIKTVTPVVYGKADGMRSIECNSNQPSGWKARDGRLWFPTVKGVVVVDPDHLNLNAVPPPVVIEQVVFDKKPLDLREQADLPLGQRELEFHYTGLSFLDPSKVLFKYKLEGYDENWVDADTRRTAYYTNLSLGSYRFRVIACNNDGVWNETGAAFDFYLRPYWHERWWVRALFGLALILMAVALYAKYRKAREEVERMATVGTVVAGVAHDASNPLLAIRTEAYNMEERPNNPEAAGTRQSQLKTIRQQAERLNSLMKDLLDFAGSMVLELTPTSPENLLNEAVETYRDEHDPIFPQIVVESAPGLPPISVDRDRMVRVLMNLIENAVKHAKDMKTVTLSAEFAPARERPSQICIRVANDGAGMNRKVMRKIFKPGFTTGNGSGLGLAVVQYIVRRHGATITVDSQPMSGTVFTICLPTTPPAGEIRNPNIEIRNNTEPLNPNDQNPH